MDRPQAAMRTNDSGWAGRSRIGLPTGAEGLAVEDHLALVALDRNLVGFLDMDAVELGPPEPADQAGEKARIDTGFCSTATNLSGPFRAPPRRQQQLFQRGDEQEGKRPVMAPPGGTLTLSGAARAEGSWRAGEIPAAGRPRRR